MRVVATYIWDDGDVPSPRNIEECFNQLLQFFPRLRSSDKSSAKAAYNRVVCNKEFTLPDFEVLSAHVENGLCEIEQKYSAEPFQSAPWGESIMMAVYGLRGVMVGLSNLIKRSEIGGEQ